MKGIGVGTGVSSLLLLKCLLQDWDQCLHSGCCRVHLRDLWFALASAVNKTVKEEQL